MQPAALAEAFAGSQRGGTAHAQAARLFQQPVADRLALVAAPLLGDEGQSVDSLAWSVLPLRYLPSIQFIENNPSRVISNEPLTCVAMAPAAQPRRPS